MVSVYEYTTVAALESYAATDYATVHATYTDAVVESNISQSERYVNIYCKQSFTGTIPDAVVAVTQELSRRLMHNIMVNDGKLSGIDGKALELYEIVIDDNMKEMLAVYVESTLVPISLHRTYTDVRLSW